MNLIWHYTIKQSALSILKDGQINPSTNHLYGNEKPSTWFSAHPYFEPTATQRVTAEGDRPATFDEMCRAGLFRFGISPEKLIRWPEIIKTAEIHPDMVNHLVQDGIAKGANPLDWFGIHRPVTLSEIESIEQFDGANWIPYVKE